MERLKNSKYEVFLLLIILTSIILLFLQNLSLTGNFTEGSIPSNVSLSKFLAISFGEILSEGIQFGTVSFLPATNINASHNYDGGSNGTDYIIEVHQDSNTNVDFCIKANVGLTSSALDVIGLGNETYSAFSSTNSTYPLLSEETLLTTSYVKSATDIGIGNSSYWRFWLDIPAAQPSGNYNNTLFFEGVTIGSDC